MDEFEEHKPPVNLGVAIALCGIFGLVAIVLYLGATGNGAKVNNSALDAAKQQTSVASVKDPDQVLQEATATLAGTERGEGENYRAFNARVTKAYNAWVAAEQARFGAGWQDKYIEAHRTPKTDCSQFYGSLIHEDALIQTLRVACAAQQYAPEPTVPALADYLVRPDPQESNSSSSAPSATAEPSTSDSTGSGSGANSELTDTSRETVPPQPTPLPTAPPPLTARTPADCVKVLNEADLSQQPQATKVFSNGGRYVGELINGVRTGRGTYFSPDGATYSGGWLNDRREGCGAMTDNSGNKIIGVFRDGELVSK